MLEIKPKKIIIAGDSAGGNLGIDITLRCIKFGIRVPDGLLLAYPGFFKQFFEIEYFFCIKSFESQFENLFTKFVDGIRRSNCSVYVFENVLEIVFVRPEMQTGK